jgi:hypothetical protein
MEKVKPSILWGSFYTFLTDFARIFTCFFFIRDFFFCQNAAN